MTATPRRSAPPFRVTDEGDEDQHPRRNHRQEAERVRFD
jgi:hypothetical protein